MVKGSASLTPSHVDAGERKYVTATPETCCFECSALCFDGRAAFRFKMKTVLMVAEKPSLAQSIAKILSKGAYKTKRSKMLSSIFYWLR